MCGRALRLRVVLTAFRRICRQRRCLEARSLAPRRYAIGSSCSQALTEAPDMLNSGTHLPNRHSGRGKMDEAKLLKQTPLFKNLGADDIERMAQSTRIQNYKAGQTIVIEGRVGAAFFIVIEAVD